VGEGNEAMSKGKVVRVTPRVVGARGEGEGGEGK
jgi:hypothetical protein